MGQAGSDWRYTGKRRGLQVISEGKHLRTLTLDTGRTTILLENPFWHAIEYLALEDGHANWRDWFHENILEDWDSDTPLTSHVRCTVVTMFLEDLQISKSD